MIKKVFIELLIAAGIGLAAFFGVYFDGAEPFVIYTVVVFSMTGYVSGRLIGRAFK